MFAESQQMIIIFLKALMPVSRASRVTADRNHTQTHLLCSSDMQRLLRVMSTACVCYMTSHDDA